MTSKEYIVWLKGFVTACNDYAPTPKQWDIIKEELDKVSDSYSSVSIGTGGTGILNIPNLNTSVTCKYPENSTWTYSNGENKKQQLND